MSLFSTIGKQAVPIALLPASATAGGKAAGAQTAPASGNVAARLPVVEPAAAASDNVSLSSQALASRVSDLGNATIDVAQAFINSFATRLFGDKANGATLTFSAASLSADASASASVAHSSGQGGGIDKADFSLSESSHFIGTGQLVTADGQTFQFEIEVSYNADVRASAQTSQTAPQITAPDVLALTGKPLPAIEFPGSLADLFKLLGRELQAHAPNNPNRADNGENGNLTLRLLRLVNSAALIAPRVQPDDPKASAADRNKALANSYAAPQEPAASAEIATA